MERGRRFTVYSLHFFSPRRLAKERENMICLTDFLLNFSRLSFHSRVIGIVFLPRSFFFLRSPLLFYDISCLKTENWSKLARSRAREINSPFVSWKNSSFIIAVFFSVFSVRFFFAFCSFLSTAERSRVEIRDGR